MSSKGGSGSKDNEPGKSLWSKEYQDYKQGNKSDQSSSSSNFNWDKAVNDAIKEKKEKPK